MSSFRKVAGLLKKARSVLIGSHYNPDGDCIGSMLALGLALERLGKEVLHFNRDAVPSHLLFLQGSGKVVQSIPATRSFDVAILVDCAETRRVGGDFERAIKKAKQVLCVDHHKVEKTDAALSVIDPDASATGEMMVELIQELDAEIDQPIAEQLFSAIAVDTGFFRYSNTTAKVLRLAAELVDAGANVPQIASSLHESFPVARYRLLGMALGVLEIKKEISYASMYVTQKMFRDSGAEVEHTEGFATYPRAIKGIAISAFFREQSDGRRIKVSLRSSGRYDLTPIARHFDGGGHPYAAGCTIEGDMATAKAMIEKGVRKLVKGS